MVGSLASGRSERLFLPQRLSTYAVHGECATGRAVPVNDSLLVHFDKLHRPSLLVRLSARNAMALETSFHTQSEALSYSMWVLSGLLGFIRLQDFTPTDPALFNQLVTALSKSLSDQAQVSASHTSLFAKRGGSFIYLICHVISATSISFPCSLLPRSSPTPCSERRTSRAFRM